MKLSIFSFTNKCTMRPFPVTLFLQFALLSDVSVLSGVVDKHLDHNDNGRAQKPDFGQINLITVSMQAMHITTLNKT